MRNILHVLLGASSLTAISVGSWWLNPAAGLIVPGSLVLTGIIYSRVRK